MAHSVLMRALLVALTVAPASAVINIKHPLDAWWDTYYSLGGWKGICVITVVLFIFMQIVETVIPMRHTYNGAYAKAMKGKRKGE
mmetsp:Transcript_96137/g.273985  ORF Transcript_96137/g.273985 Transcript_96137/m.273985 type:complete len:85 (+) Transcript_96137:1-255(+)